MSDGIWYAWPGRITGGWEWGTGQTICIVRPQAAEFRFDTRGR